MNTLSRIVLAALILFVPCTAMAQEEVLINIAGKNVYKSDFLKVYQKNTKEAAFDEKSIKEYLELYINYKLKVHEAEVLQMDTGAAFNNELAGYRKQLAQPYLIDKDVTEKLVKEAYERMKYDVNAGHILFRVAPDAMPKDTIEAYNKAMSTRASLLKGGDFYKVAAEVSEDPSAKENKGDLGYFTGLQMLYPFETAAFTMKNGDLSMPVRTRFGYHIIKKFDQRPAVGEIRAAHIMVKLPKDSPDSVKKQTKDKIMDLYNRLKNGENFETLATEYSDDRASGKTGGALPWFGTGRMVAEFEKAAFALKNDGDYSEPILSSYGWHIIKRLERRTIPSFEEKEAELRSSVARDSRSELSKSNMVAKIKNEYGFKEYPKAVEEFVKSLDSTLLDGEWHVDKAAKFSKPVFDFAGKTYTQKDFANYIFVKQTRKTNTSPQNVGIGMYENYETETLIAYQETKLDEKYPDFKALMSEYRDGILLFNLTDEKVWSKAVKDSSGLAAYYETIKNRYMWGERAKADIYTCSDASISAKAKKCIKKKMSAERIIETLNKGGVQNISIQSGVYSKGENEIVDAANWGVGVSTDVKRDDKILFAHIKSMVTPEAKKLDEARGLITADYQNYLEAEWIKELRGKYKVDVNQTVLNSIIQP
ncbi:MAG TPA: peptidylprolyl isomerase [Bacteroidia bacterium]|nr:peptidylprolyl isomerase [Bacteroidia bacterium]